MRILYPASELDPVNSRGALGRTSRFLSEALREIGADIRVVVPAHGRAIRLFEVRSSGVRKLRLDTPSGPLDVSVLEIPAQESTPAVWWVRAPELFEIEDNVYGTRRGPKGLGATRWVLFARLQYHLTRHFGFIPDVLLTHDWPAALTPALWRTDHVFDLDFAHTASVHLISSLEHAGRLLPADYRAAGGREDLISEWYLLFQKDVSLLRGALVFADRIIDWTGTLDALEADDARVLPGHGGLEFLLEARRDDVQSAPRPETLKGFAAAARQIFQAARAAREDRVRGRRDAELLRHIRLEPAAPAPGPKRAIPEFYSTDVFRLMIRDPWTLYAYWEIRGELTRPILEQIPEESRRAARFEIRLKNEKNGAEWTQPVDPAATNWFVKVEPYQRYSAELWICPRDQAPLRLLSAPAVDTPPDWECER